MPRLGHHNRSAAPKPSTTISVCNEQVQRFVLLAHILEAAGLTPAQVKTCMEKYVAVLSREKSCLLLFDLPKVEDINNMGPLSDMAIANLSDGNMSIEAVTRAAQLAKLRFVESPDSGHGEQGWLRELLHVLAREAKQNKQGKKRRAWFDNPDSALWLAIMARVQIILSAGEWRGHLPVAVRDAYRDGWLGVFDVQRVERKLPVASAPIDAVVGWDGVLKAKTVQKRNPKPAAVAAAAPPLLTQEFFPSQTKNPTYLSLIAEIPAVVRKSANELRQQLGLPQIALEKPQANSSRVQTGNFTAQGNSKAQKKHQAQKPQPEKLQAETGISELQAETSKEEYYNAWPELDHQAQQPQTQTDNSKAQAEQIKPEISWAAVVRRQQPRAQQPQVQRPETQTANSKPRAGGGKQKVSWAVIARKQQLQAQQPQDQKPQVQKPKAQTDRSEAQAKENKPQITWAAIVRMK